MNNNSNSDKTQEIWYEFSSVLENFILKNVKNKDATKDILQETFIKIHNNIENLKEESKLNAWIYQIVKNQINDYFRIEKKLKAEELKDVFLDEAEFEEDKHKKIQQGLLSMVKNLPNKYKEPLIMADFKGIKQKEIASKLDISVSGAKSRVQRGRKLLKKELLNCCHFELDKYGKVIDYYPLDKKCSAKKGDC